MAGHSRPDRQAPGRPWRPGSFGTSGFSLGILAGLVAAAVLLLGLGGWRYYLAALDVRPYTDLHKLLRPSGIVGHLLGISGLTLMVLMHLYSLRKRAPRLSWMGPTTSWLEIHIFCGVIGPVLTTFHTAFRFNGVVSVAFWSMLVVMLSGVIGRYLYVRIPRSIRGQEIGHQELAARVRELAEGRADGSLPVELPEMIEAFETAMVPSSEATATWAGLILGEISFYVRLAALGRRSRRLQGDRAAVAEVMALTVEAVTLRRRIAYLKKTKRLFDLWTVYHKPLAILMAVIVALHVATVAYFGYAFPTRMTSP